MAPQSSQPYAHRECRNRVNRFFVAACIYYIGYRGCDADVSEVTLAETEIISGRLLRR